MRLRAAHRVAVPDRRLGQLRGRRRHRHAECAPSRLDGALGEEGRAHEQLRSCQRFVSSEAVGC